MPLGHAEATARHRKAAAPFRVGVVARRRAPSGRRRAALRAGRHAATRTDARARAVLAIGAGCVSVQ
ncbi:hypothetical protein C7S16_4965 [Burkholderia thailandensis]|uniref:Uncharacterized protein n=1 Tax=Burkholderia thailandensis TaxID=57975 RepID=A0AAW9CTN9_BURTH|nr:hypothetical protein [Burkholderia thailandensis]MDW9253006.1 hypothetical protein [Burkholderia thailandensis]